MPVKQKMYRCDPENQFHYHPYLTHYDHVMCMPTGFFLLIFFQFRMARQNILSLHLVSFVGC